MRRRQPWPRSRGRSAAACLLAADGGYGRLRSAGARSNTLSSRVAHQARLGRTPPHRKIADHRYPPAGLRHPPGYNAVAIVRILDFGDERLGGDVEPEKA